MSISLALPDSGPGSRGALRRAMLAGLLLLSALFSALPAAADEDVPDRVGRIADVAGDLFLAPQDAPDQWNAIGLNYPVVTGDNIYVGKEGRAEIDFGSGQFRLSGETSLHVSRLDDRNFALFVAQGAVILRVRVLDPGESARIDTPNAQVALTRPGLYRIEVAPDGQHSLIAVREGEAVVDAGASVEKVLPGQNATLDGAGPSYTQLRNGIATDGFDAWSASRDRRYDRVRANAPVSRQMVGTADLDDYGAWESAPEYGGAVWYPANVAPDWAPYRVGYWTEVGVWGPTWVDAAPWGYAPFHYGRWAYIRGRWGWCPGAYVARPVWAPALVGWVGGPGWRVGAGAPVYGWVPLGWGESYQPHWRGCSDGCWARYNRPYAVNVTVRIHTPPARYANFNAPGAVTAVAAPVFSERRPVQAHLVAVNSSALATAPVLATPPARREARPVSGVRPGNGVPQPASTIQAATPRQPRSFGSTAAIPTQVPSTAAPAPGTAGGQSPARAFGGGAPPASSGFVRQQQVTTPPSVSTNTGDVPRAPSGISNTTPATNQSVALPQVEPRSRAQPALGVSGPQAGTGQPATPSAAEFRHRTPSQAAPATVPATVPPTGFAPQGATPPPKPAARNERIPVPATLAPAPLPQVVAPLPHAGATAPAPHAPPPSAPVGVMPQRQPQESAKVDRPAAPKIAVPAETPAR
ncbi:MAG TPA: hypothetical protein PLW68_01775 [Casimicrobiaceae bacterium]|nr:hypothetical protein [Casimicrobiaceae bacterium]